MTADWFKVDRDGLRQVLGRIGNERAVLEMLSNCLDEHGVTSVNIGLESIEGRRGIARLVVEDDAPNGFADLTHAYTLYAPSAKKHNEEQRGRFNIGEKFVLALCTEAEIITTTGGVRFDDEGRHSLRQKRERGSIFTAEIRFTKLDIAATKAVMDTVLIPQGITVTFNGEVLAPRVPVHTFKVQLPTEKADEEGYLRPTKRFTQVNLYDPRPGEEAHLYELGVPVVMTEDRYHVDVMQKVPLNTDRDNVTPSYLRQVRTAVMNETYQRLNSDDAKETWAREALADDNIKVEAVVHTMDLLFGEKRVSYDPTDLKANKRAVSEGYELVYGGSLSRDQWQNVRRAEAILPAGQVTPGHHIELGLNGESSTPSIPREKWTQGMVRLAYYTQRLGDFLLGFEPKVKFYSDITMNFLAEWGNGTIGFNIGKLGRAWVDSPNQQKVDELLLHEFGHHRVSDHLSYDYPNEIARLGAILRTARVWVDDVTVTEEDEAMLLDVGRDA